MPLLLEDQDIDVDAEAIDMQLTDAEEAIAADLSRGSDDSSRMDLSDGGKVGGATLYPMRDGPRVEKGRPAARRAWMWNGTESVIPLTWNPDGTIHDGGRRFLRKKYCLCCTDAGFIRHCRKCRDNLCPRCNSSRDPSKIIPCFYLREVDVPYPEKLYGSVNCFLPSCARKGEIGFKTEEDMRMHALSRHTKQYEAHESVKRSGEASEISELRKTVNDLVAAALATQVSRPVLEPEDMVGTPEAPLYVSKNPKKPRKIRGRNK